MQADEDNALPNTVKLFWATSVAHLLFSNVVVNLTLPQSVLAYAWAIAGMAMVAALAVCLWIVWLIARGLRRGRFWASFLVVAILLLSFPPRVWRLVYDLSPFDGPKFSFSFIAELAWLVADIVLLGLLIARATGKSKAKAS